MLPSRPRRRRSSESPAVRILLVPLRRGCSQPVSARPCAHSSVLFCGCPNHGSTIGHLLLSSIALIMPLTRVPSLPRSPNRSALKARSLELVPEALREGLLIDVKEVRTCTVLHPIVVSLSLPSNLSLEELLQSSAPTHQAPLLLPTYPSDSMRRPVVRTHRYRIHLCMGAS